MNKLSIVLLLLLSTYCGINNLYSQDLPTFEFNQTDESGLRTGIWVEEDYYKTFDTYKNGVLNGISLTINPKTNKPYVICEFSNGEYSGTWYAFDDDGRLIYMLTDFKKNTLPAASIHGVQRVNGDIFENQCYSISFYKNGNKESEGILQFDDAPDSDFSFEYGLWKYYDENGCLIKTKMYK